MIKNIQILRAVAANVVVLAHILAFEQKYGNGNAVLPDVLHAGAAGVDLFFVISGFIIASIATASCQQFMLDRITRIFPLYWFYTTILLAISLVLPNMVSNDIARQPILMLQSYLLIPGEKPPLLSVAWTLIHEMYFYITFAAVLAFRLPLRKVLPAWAALVLAGSYFAPAIAMPLFTLIANPITLEFLAGMYIALVVGSGGIKYARTALYGGGGLFLFACLTCGSAVDQLDWYRVLCFGLPSALLVYGAVAVEMRHRATPSAWLIRLGDASYSIYLCHGLVLSAIWRLEPLLPMQGTVVKMVLVALSMVTANLAGIASHRWIEQPLLEYVRRYTRRRPVSGLASQGSIQTL